MTTSHSDTDMSTLPGTTLAAMLRDMQAELDILRNADRDNASLAADLAKAQADNARLRRERGAALKTTDYYLDKLRERDARLTAAQAVVPPDGVQEMAAALIAWSGDVPDRPLSPTEDRLGCAVTGPVLDWLCALTAHDTAPVISAQPTEQKHAEGDTAQSEPTAAELRRVLYWAFRWHDSKDGAPGGNLGCELEKLSQETRRWAEQCWVGTGSLTSQPEPDEQGGERRRCELCKYWEHYCGLSGQITEAAFLCARGFTAKGDG